MTERTRLDILVWRRGLATSRTQAQALVLAGKIAVNGERMTRPGTPVMPQAALTRLGASSRYVSRGGEKLAAALATFAIEARQRVAMDVGASTGGFTDCLLQAGVARVYAVDVGYGQLHWRLRTDPRVVVYERTNARYLQPLDIPEPISLLSLDVSFISLRLLLPVLARLLKATADVVALIKPQFEVGKGQVGKGGVVRDPQQHYQVLRGVLSTAQACGFEVRAGMVSPLLGPKGNREFLVHLGTGVYAGKEIDVESLCTALSHASQTDSSIPGAQAWHAGSDCGVDTPHADEPKNRHR
jgi:23S rRNA (cytidine1920-2'-O)/16S rRNA (cytidine1409-2'-O)-methyltransferase